MEMLVVLLALVGGLLALIHGARPPRAAMPLAVASVVLVLASSAVRGPQGDPLRGRAPPQLPAAETDFVTSDTCRSCHPGEHASWHATYHRTMTQRATPRSVYGDFGVGQLEDRGHTAKLWRDGDTFWVECNDPMWELANRKRALGGPPPRITAQIVMVTGSHHLQTYWLRRPRSDDAWHRPDDGAWFQFPWVWHIAEQRWVPTQDSFLTPPSRARAAGTPWNTSCNLCHSVGTQPGIATDHVDTRTAELGIACEACHGPGAEHVAAHRSPLHRYLRHFANERDADAGDPTIVNPARLSKDRSTMVCGQCHSFHKELDMERWQETGVAYRAGDDLDDTKAVFGYTEEPDHPRLLQHLEVEPDALDGRFWKDGTIRVAGREYNGLLESPCHTQGEMTCLSCHAMHGYDRPDDQLRPGAVDAACVDCHAEIAEQGTAHHHHERDSAGASCVNCHMPHTTWGLFTAMRAHRIDNPRAAVTVDTGRPNACNQCHVDRTLDWTARTLRDWYGHELPPDLEPDQMRISQTLLDLLRGNAAQRAVAAWTLGWDAAREASGSGWQAHALARALADPYAAVRKASGDALRRQPELAAADLDFDFVPPADRQQPNVSRALQAWRAVAARPPADAAERLLLAPDGEPLARTIQRLQRARDDTPLRIIE